MKGGLRKGCLVTATGPRIPSEFVVDAVALEFYQALCTLPFYGENYSVSSDGEPNYSFYDL